MTLAESQQREPDNTRSRCGRCGLVVEDAPQGICPRCLLEGALAAAPPRSVGDYQLVEEIGRGSMGVVYRARHATIGHEVALKLIRAGELASERETEQFLLEARAASRLSHPAIIRIFHVGQDDGQPYFTMELIAGGSLDAAASRLRGDPLGVARLLAVVARAVQHGHDRGVLHRDLKPSNILVDERFHPSVADFGVAKIQGEDGPTLGGGAPGTLSYMAPEQIAGSEATRAGDLWSLGVVLYELLTGRLPFAGRSLPALSRAIQEDEPPPLGQLVPRLDRDLETVCLKCLAKDPERRYRSALDLAEDLERWLRSEPIAARPLGPAARALRWARRHPMGTALCASAFLLAAGVTLGALSVAREQELELRRDVLRTNAYAARAVAGAVLFELRRLAEQVEAAARDPGLIAALERGPAGVSTDPGASRRLAAWSEGGPLDNLALFDSCGTGIARFPAGGDAFLGRDFSWRDYFRGARRLGELGRREAYVSRAHHSEVNGQWGFAIAAPVYAADGRWVGVTRATISTRSVLGSLRLSDPSDQRRRAVLVGPMDNDRSCADCPPPTTWLVLLHDALEPGQAVEIAGAPFQRLVGLRAGASSFAPSVPAPTLTETEHRDPLGGGRWLAAFEPVGGTGYVVLVETREDAAVEPTARLSLRLGRVVAWAVAAGLALAGGIAWLNRRRRPAIWQTQRGAAGAPPAP